MPPPIQRETRDKLSCEYALLTGFADEALKNLYEYAPQVQIFNKTIESPYIDHTQLYSQQSVSPTTEWLGNRNSAPGGESQRLRLAIDIRGLTQALAILQIAKFPMYVPERRMLDKYEEVLPLGTSWDIRRCMVKKLDRVGLEIQKVRLQLIREHYFISFKNLTRWEDDSDLIGAAYLVNKPSQCKIKRVCLNKNGPDESEEELELYPDLKMLSNYKSSENSLTSIVNKLLPNRPVLSLEEICLIDSKENRRGAKEINSSKTINNSASRTGVIGEPTVKPELKTDNTDGEEDDEFKPANSFKTAKSVFDQNSNNKFNANTSKKKRGVEENEDDSVNNKRGCCSNNPSIDNKVSKPFVNPSTAAANKKRATNGTTFDSGMARQPSEDDNYNDTKGPEYLKNIDEVMVERIKNEIMNLNQTIEWSDIAGLSHAKSLIEEIVVLPMLRPDLFTGLLSPPKGLLLFGPPGTGKTLIGRCIASQSKATFFSISASSLTSKWVGDGEKMVRALFAVARCHQPAVVFVDEIDSLLTQRSDNEVEASRRIKTEFLIQLDGCTTDSDDRVLIIGATNRPHEIDEAARRRFTKRVYIPLPDAEGRAHIIRNLLARASNQHSLSEAHIKEISQFTEGYSGSDMSNLCREAAMGPIKEVRKNILTIEVMHIRGIDIDDFRRAKTQVRASVESDQLDALTKWNNKFGSLN